jgi:hypothetical protein
VQKGTSEVDFTINLSPDLKRSKTTMPVNQKKFDLTQQPVKADKKSKEDKFAKKPVLAGHKRGKKTLNVHHGCKELRYTATSKWNDMITDRQLEQIEIQMGPSPFSKQSDFDVLLENYKLRQ